MKSTIIDVRIPSATYQVEIGTGLLPLVASRLTALVGEKAKPIIVTSPEIYKLHGAVLTSGFATPPPVLEVPAGEQYKRFATIERLCEELAQHGADRDTILIAFGGGVLGDMTGFLAAIYMRGIRFIQVPTTALAQIDSSVGGKTGANLAAGKNLIGAFHHPLAVYADIDTLATLPSNELRAGLQESVKAGIIRDPDLFEYLDAHSDAILSGSPEHLAHVIAASVQMKATVVANDERETGERMLLNLGHTLGHAIEAATGYNTLLHGEAIAWGMIAAFRLAHQRQLITSAEGQLMISIVKRYGPLKPFTADPADLVARTAKDKKNRSGTRNFILPTCIGEAIVVRDVTDAELLKIATSITTEAGGA